MTKHSEDLESLIASIEGVNEEITKLLKARRDEFSKVRSLGYSEKLFRMILADRRRAKRRKRISSSSSPVFSDGFLIEFTERQFAECVKAGREAKDRMAGIAENPYVKGDPRHLRWALGFSYYEPKSVAMEKAAC